MLNGYIYFQVLYNNILIEKNSHKLSMQRNLEDDMDEGGRELEGWEDMAETDVWGLFAIGLGTPRKKLLLGPHHIAEKKNNTQWNSS